MSNVSKICNIPHGIVFIYDPSMIIDVPHDTGAESILATENCVSVWTKHEDDGNVEIIISDSEVECDENLRFSGEILIDSGHISFNDSGVNEIIGIDTIKGRVKIQIYSDDPQYPEKVLCRVIK